MANQVELLSLNINTQQLLAKLSETKKVIDELQASQKQLTAAGLTSSNQFVSQAAQLKQLSGQYNNQQNILNQLNAAKENAANVADSLNAAIHKEIRSVQEATENNKILKSVRNQLDASTVEGAQAIAILNEKLDENTKFIKENVSAAEKQKMTIGGYKDQITEALSAINPFNGGLDGFSQRATEAGGAGNLLKNSFSQLATGIGGATKAALSFIATPIGAVVAGVVAAFAAGKAIFDFNQGLQQSNKELKALGVNADEISKVRSEIQATASTFDKDFKDIASKANSLSKAYGISMSEANDIIAQGLASGGAQNEEFLDSLGEYDQLFKNAGFSAQEFVNVINTGYDLGVYADKLPDAIKESGLALTEQSKATRDALVNAFGANFSDDILKKVRTGEMTTKEALQAIAAQSEKTQLTQQQQAQLTADVFKGAGEDAGGALKILQAIGQASQKEMDSAAKKQLELQEATERLNKAQAELFEIKDFGDIWTSIKVTATEGLAAIIEYISDVKKDIQPLIDLVSVVFANAWATLKTTIGVVFDFISGNFRVIGNVISTFFNFFKNLIQGDFTGAIKALTDGFQNLLNIVENTFGRIKNTIIDGIKAIIDNISPALKVIGIDVANLQKTLDGLKSKEVELKSKSTASATSTQTDQRTVVADVDPNAAEKAKKAAEEAKKAREEQIKAIDAAIKKQKEEIDLFVAQQGFKKKSIEDQLKVDEQLMNKRLALNDFEYKNGKLSKEAYETAKLTLTSDFAKKQAEAMVANAEVELESYRKKLEQQKAEDTFFSEEKLIQVKAQNDALLEKELEYQLLRKEQGIINEQEYLLAIDTVREENRIANEEAETERKEAAKEAEAIDYANEQEIIAGNKLAEFEAEGEHLKQLRAQELANVQNTGADKDKINKKFDKLDRDLAKQTSDYKLDIASQTFGNIAQLMGENSSIGKAAAVAQTTIDTYKGATAAYSAMSGIPIVGPALGAVAAAVVVAAGLANVRKIMSTKVPSRAAGGIIPKLSSGVINNGSNLSVPLRNGDDTLAYVKQGEMILNEEQQRRAGGASFFRSIGVPSFAGGGYVSGTSNLGQQGGYKIDMDELATKIGQEVGRANLSLPSPRVSVDDINLAQEGLAVVVSGANY